MGKKQRHMCTWAKDDRVVRKLCDFKELVERPRFACKRCARVAAAKRYLCKPIHLD